MSNIDSEEMKRKLKERGYNRDFEISEEKWKDLKDICRRSSLSLATIELQEEATYRDSRKRDSIELKDYRNRSVKADFVVELEHYNPEERPLMHVLVDFPNWLWKNRLKNWGPKTRESE